MQKNYFCDIKLQIQTWKQGEAMLSLTCTIARFWYQMWLGIIRNFLHSWVEQSILFKKMKVLTKNEIFCMSDLAVFYNT